MKAAESQSFAFAPGFARAIVSTLVLACALAEPASAAEPAVGSKIDKLNMEKSRELLPPSVQLMLELGMTIEVAEHASCPWPKKFIDATEQYAKQVELSDDMKSLEGYVAGMPFPTIDANDPAAAWKIMWNHEHKPAFSDDVRTEWIVENQDDRGFVEREFKVAELL